MKRRLTFNSTCTIISYNLRTFHIWSTIRLETASQLPLSPQFSNTQSNSQIGTSSNFSTDSNNMKKNSRWLDFSIVKEKGRAFDADNMLIPSKDATLFFPNVPCTTLNGESIGIPNQMQQQQSSTTSSSKPNFPIRNWNNVKFVTLSFKHYGSTLVKSWQEPFNSHFQNISPTLSPLCFEMCFIEYGFLSMAKGVLINSLKKTIPIERHSNVGFAFGGIKEFADKLDIPNVFTGYVFLIDNKGRVRWRGCGLAKPEEIKTLIKCAELLSQEPE